MRQTQVVSGKKLIPALLIGFLVFTLVMGYGTAWIAQRISPALARRDVEREKAKLLEQRREQIATEKARQSGSTP